MPRRVRTHDWSATPLGPIEAWPASLKFAVDTLLSGGFPMVALWGPDLIQIYNDEYRDLMGVKHPAGLGQPTSECWPEVWHINAPIYERVLAGETVRVEGGLHPITRSGAPAGAWFTLAYSPLRNEAGEIAGVLVTIVETSERVRAPRENETRQAFLLKFSDALRAESNEDAIIDLALRMLGEELGLDRCYATVLYPEEDRTDVIREFRRPGLLPMPSTLRNPDFPEAEAQAFHGTPIFDDTANDPELTDTDKRSLAATNFGTFLSSPLRHATGYPFWFLGAVSSEPRRWTSGEVALMEEATERTWAAVERARVEAALREGEARLRLALDAAEMGSFVWFPAEDRAEPDARTLALFGMAHPGEMTFRRVLELLHPDDRGGHTARVARALDPSGDGALRSEVRVAHPDGTWRWLSLAGQTRFDARGRAAGMTGAVRDTTGGKAAEAALREREERNAFLLALGDAMRARSGANAMIEVAARLLGERLDASRVMFAEFDEARGIADIFHGWFADGAEPFPAVMRLADYDGPILDDLRAGRTVRIEDAGEPSSERPDLAAIAAVGVKALLSVPLVIGGRLAVNLSVHQHTARHWTDADVALVREVAERLWADLVRARAEAALRESEARNALLVRFADEVRGLSDPALVAEASCRILTERLGTDRALWAVIDWDTREYAAEWAFRADGTRAEPSRWPLDPRDSFAAEHLAGRSVAYDDGEADPRIPGPVAAAMAERGLRAGIAVPVLVAGTLRAVLNTSQPTAPRRWRPEEVAFVEALAGRAWAEIERARAEAALRESEGRFRALAGAVEDVFYMTDLDHGALLYLSPSYERVWGRPASELLADLSGFEATIHPDDRPAFHAAKAAQARGEPVVAEYRVLRPDGAVRWVFDRSFPVPGGPGRRAAGTASDVTARKRAEAALRESKARFREFANASSDVLWIRDADTLCFEYVSPAFEAVYGDGFERVFGGNNLRRWAELILPEDRERVLDNFRRVRAGERVTHEFRIRRPCDGEVRWIRDTDFPLLDEAGRVRRVAGIGSDVTEAKRAAERQRVLIAELQHRGRNLLGVVRSLASKTIGRGGPVEGFEDRLAALSRAQGQLSRAGGDRVELESLVRAELEAHADVEPPKVVVSGPKVTLSVEQVQTFALALHELATNAVKYGALMEADGTGRLAVTWTVADGADGGGADGGGADGGGADGGGADGGGAAGDSGTPRLVLDWVESGVEVRPEAATRRGYGSELIERALTYSLRAKTEHVLGPDGVRCRVEMPLVQHG